MLHEQPTYEMGEIRRDLAEYLITVLDGDVRPLITELLRIAPLSEKTIAVRDHAAEAIVFVKIPRNEQQIVAFRIDVEEPSMERDRVLCEADQEGVLEWLDDNQGDLAWINPRWRQFLATD